MTSVGSRCFYGCTSLISINITETVDGSNNTVITIPSGSIGDYAFHGCTRLFSGQYVTLNNPTSVTIGQYGFSGTALSGITATQNSVTIG